MKREFLRLFPVPHMLVPKAVGLAIEDDSITLVQACVPSSAHDVLRIPLEASVIERGELKDKTALHLALVAARRMSNHEHVIVSLPTDAGFLVRMELDSATSDIVDSVLLGIEEYVPVDPAELLVSVELVDVSSQGAKRVLVTAYPSAVVTAYEEALVGAGFTPVAAESSMHSLARALVHEKTHESTLLVTIGRWRTHAIVVVACRPWLISTVGMGWQRIVDSVTRAGQIQPSEAEHLVFTQGFSYLANRDLFSLMVPAVAALRDEVGKVLRFWDSHKERGWDKVRSIDSVILTGHGAAIPGIERHMEVGLNMRMHVVSPWDDAARQGSAVSWVLRNESFSYTAATGAYIRAHNKQW